MPAKNNWGKDNADLDFINPDISYKTSYILPDLKLKNNSPVIDKGIPLTYTKGSGSTSLILIVEDAKYFQDGSWGSVLTHGVTHFPDEIAIGSVDNIVEIASINYDTNTITLASSKTWNDGDPIWLYKDSRGNQVLYGSAPDIGAFEYTSDSNVVPNPLVEDFVTIQDMLNAYQDYKTNEVSLLYFLDKLRNWIVFW